MSCNRPLATMAIILVAAATNKERLYAAKQTELQLIEIQLANVIGERQNTTVIQLVIKHLLQHPNMATMQLF